MREAKSRKLGLFLHRALGPDLDVISVDGSEETGPDDKLVRDALDLSVRLGDALLSVGASAHETEMAAQKTARLYGLDDVHANVTFNSIIVSYQQGPEDWPATIMRTVKWNTPDHKKLQDLQELLRDIEGGLPLEFARKRLRAIRRAPFPYRPSILALASATLAMGVSIMYGVSVVMMALTFFAALCAAVVQLIVGKWGTPTFFSQVAGGFTVTMVATGATALSRHGIEPFTGIRPSLIVVAGIMMMLAGVQVVSATQDAIDGFAVTASGRVMDLSLVTLGLVVGITLALELASSLGYPIVLQAQSQPYASVGNQMLGAVLVAGAVALFNGASLRGVAVSGLLAIFTMTGYTVAIVLGAGSITASGMGALCSSFVGGLIAYRYHLPSVAISTAAIVPLVPGGAVFRGILGLVQEQGPSEGLVIGATSFVSAIMTGVALAAGASLGLYMNRPLVKPVKDLGEDEPDGGDGPDGEPAGEPAGEGAQDVADT